MNIKNGLSLKQNLIGLGLIGAIALGAIAWASQGEAKDIYDPLAPQAERVYQAAIKTACEAELNLVQAKLMDAAKNALELTPEQARDLQAKKLSMKCDQGFQQ